MKTRTTLALIFSVLSLHGFGQTAELTAEQVLEKNIEATGGKAAYEAQKSSIMIGDLNLSTMGVKGSLTTYSKGNKILVITSIPNLMTQKQGFDGKTAWTEDTINGLRKLWGAERDSLVRSATSSTVNWKSFYKEVKLSGKEKVGDRETYVIVMTPKTGEPIKSYYDAENFMILRTVTTVKSPQGTFESDMTFADYRDESGVKMAHKMNMKVGPSDVEINITKVEVNVNIDDKKFEYPGYQKDSVKTKPKTGNKAAGKPKK